MKIWLPLTMLLLSLPLASRAGYAINWHTIGGGGGTSSNGQYVVSGTIGQPDAGRTMQGGSYSLTGGFWSLISVLQTPGMPHLNISHSGNRVVISWADTGSYTLQQNAHLSTPAGWTDSSLTVTTTNGVSSAVISAPAGNLFFRLR